MQGALPPLLTAVLAWWVSTGALFWLISRAPHTYRSTALATTGLALVAMVAVVALRPVTGPLGAYAGFAAGLALWAWHESLFLLGFVAGPRRSPCPEGLSTWRRFRLSTAAVIHHEVAIAVHGAAILALSWQAPNQVAAWTFFLLWGMRLNAKMVVFLGAPNLSDAFLPKHLAYLSTYFGQRRVTVFFPVFITFATAAATILTQAAMAASLTSTSASAETVSGGASALWLLTGLAWLAVFEHWAMVLPIPDEALWRWAIPAQKSRPGSGPDTPSPTPATQPAAQPLQDIRDPRRTP